MEKIMKKKKYLIIPVVFIVFVAVFLIFISNRPHTSFSEKWNTISQDFETINNYAMTKFSDDRSYIQLSDLADSNDENINSSLSAVQEYFKNYFDGGSYIQIVDKGDFFEYTCMERHQYILVHINDNKKETIEYYKNLRLYNEKYIIDKLNDDWYLIFQHHI